MAKFTPGPWYRPTGAISNIMARKLTEDGAIGVTIATTRRAESRDLIDIEERYANARLIAAAPEMYAQLYATYLNRRVSKQDVQHIGELLARVDGEN